MRGNVVTLTTNKLANSMASKVRPSAPVSMIYINNALCFFLVSLTNR